jgi:putative addiction module killer protein
LKRIEKYKTFIGEVPFNVWFDELDLITQNKIAAYIDRVAAGGAQKNIKALGEGIFEIKIDYGPGYRVYFGQSGKVIVLLLLGGNKKTQDKDIRRAKTFWREYEQN